MLDEKVGQITECLRKNTHQSEENRSAPPSFAHYTVVLFNSSRTDRAGEGLPDCKPVSVPSRVAVIPLGPALLPGSSDLPESRTERATPSLLFGLAPRGVYPAGPDCSGRGALLPHLFTLTPREGRRYVFCGTFRETRFERVPPAVSRHAALWRPDFPPAPRSRPRGNERLPVRQASSLIMTYLNPLPRTATARGEPGRSVSETSLPRTQ